VHTTGVRNAGSSSARVHHRNLSTLMALQRIIGQSTYELFALNVLS
jgi:hypothetical protein